MGKSRSAALQSQPGMPLAPLGVLRAANAESSVPGGGLGMGVEKEEPGVQMPPPVAVQRSREANTSRSGRQVTSGQFALKTGKGSPERINSVGGQMLSKKVPFVSLGVFKC